MVRYEFDLSSARLNIVRNACIFFTSLYCLFAGSPLGILCFEYKFPYLTKLELTADCRMLSILLESANNLQFLIFEMVSCCSYSVFSVVLVMY